jgi:hypothetical protein
LRWRREGIRRGKEGIVKKGEKKKKKTKALQDMNKTHNMKCK